jgi:hypothetical protein
MVVTLECNSSPLYRLNYTVTSTTLPSFNDIILESATECQAQVIWRINPPSSDVTLSAVHNSPQDDSVGDKIQADVQLFDYLGDSIIRAYRSITYRCHFHV